MSIHYEIWKKVRRCTLLFSILISNQYIAQIEDFIREEERWADAWSMSE